MPLNDEGVCRQEDVERVTSIKVNGSVFADTATLGCCQNISGARDDEVVRDCDDDWCYKAVSLLVAVWLFRMVSVLCFICLGDTFAIRWVHIQQGKDRLTRWIIYSMITFQRYQEGLPLFIIRFALKIMGHLHGYENCGRWSFGIRRSRN